MRILFVMSHAGYVRNFENAIRALASRGHEVVVAFELDDPAWLGGRDPLAGLDVRRVDPPRRTKLRRAPRAAVRHSLDYLRYLEPAFAEAHKLRQRARRRVPGVVVAAARSPSMRRALHRVLATADRALPQRDVDEFVREQRPDVLLVSPLVGLGSSQVEFVRAARAAAVPSALLVASWDNLTTKARLRDLPDRIVVWNDDQRREAVELHDVPDERVSVTGAHTWDHWFEWRPGRTRSELCREAGLPDDRPFILYVCSSVFIAPDEVSFVERWLEALSARGIDAAVIVRPHPQNASRWVDAKLADEHARVWPLPAESPIDDRSRSNYFDSIALAAAVVGANTSALIESAISGTPVLTVLAEELREAQEGTLHFAHVRAAVDVAFSFDEHAEQLGRALDGAGANEPRRQAFLPSFVRPHGLEQAAAPLAADAVESLVDPR